MATAFIEAEPAEPQERFATLRLSEILTPGLNLAEILTQEVVDKIGQDVIRDVNLDKDSRKDWLTRYERWLAMAMQVREAKNFPWPKAANVKYPLLTVAAIQFQARAYPAIVDGSNLVKGRVLGPDPDGIKRARADRMGQHMTWQLLFRMPGWEEETDRLLLALPIVGCVFRKTYHDTVARVNVSEMVAAEDFIIDYWAKSLDSAPRYTQVLRYYPHEIREKIVSDLWLEVRAEPEAEDAEDIDALRTFYEQHRSIDLDGDGYPEPYVVTCTKDGKVARIVPCFGADEITVRVEGITGKLTEALEAEAEPEEIIRIERRQYFTKYGFIPAPDGSFYDIGFGWLLQDLSESIDGTINRMLDAGALQNAGGGFMSSSINTRGGEMRFRLGEWKRIDAAGPVNQAIYPLPAPGPSAVLFSLLQLLIGAAKEITSVQDILTGGEVPSNQPATTTIAQIEQAQKVMTAIFKRIHRAFGGELRILRRLNRDFLEEEEYFQLNDNAEGSIGREDYADADLDVVPVSDPNIASDMQKMARAQGLMMFNGDPLVNQLEIRRRVLESMGQQDVKTLLTVPAPPPDPKTVLEMVKEARTKLESEAKVRSSDASAAAGLINAAQAAYDMGLMEDAATLAKMAMRMGAEAVEESGADTGAGELPGMEEQPADAGVLGAPGDAPAGLDAGMGPGGEPPAGAAGAGSPIGPAGGDQLG